MCGFEEGIVTFIIISGFLVKRKPILTAYLLVPNIAIGGFQELQGNQCYFS